MWQVRKSAPFPIEEAMLTFDLSTQTADGGAEFVVVMARRDAVREYEAVCEDAGMHPGLVDIATLSMLNLFLGFAAKPQDDWLVIHAQPTYTSVVILRGANVMFFRNIEGEDEGIADVVHQTTMYYQDRLSGQGFSRVMLGGLGRAAGALDQMRQMLSERLGRHVDMIDPTQAAALTDRITASPEVLSSLAPLIGVMVRARAETVTA
jgi:Tfp pilus assembly PilM family ATPase